MKIVYIANTRIPTEKAHGFQICKMCEQLALANVEVKLWLPTRRNYIKKDLYSFYSVNKIFEAKYIKSFDFIRFNKILFKKSYWLQSLFFLVILIKERIDKSYIIMTRSAEIAWLFKLKGNRVVYDAHVWPKTKNSLLRYFLKKVDLVVCNSKGTLNKYKQAGFEVLLAPNGVDLNYFKSREKSRQQARKELGLPKDKFICLYVGNLLKWKGIDVIVDSAKIIEEDDFYFLIIGGSEENAKLYKYRVSSYKLKNIDFIGFKEQDVVPDYLQAADILLLPNLSISQESIEYTSPIKMFEYMASKRLILASDLPSIREVLNSSNSVLFPAGDARSLVNRLKQIKRGEVDVSKFIQQAYEDVQQFTWQKRAKKIIRKIKEL